MHVCVLAVSASCDHMNEARQPPLSMEFSRQEYCSGLPFPTPCDLPDLGLKPVTPALAGGFFIFSKDAVTFQCKSKNLVNAVQLLKASL